MASAASKTSSKQAISDRIEREYRLYRIVAGDLGKVCKAVAYLGMGGAPAIEAVEAASVDEAISSMEDILAARLNSMREQRRDGIPTAVEFREALAALPAGLRESVRSFQIERLDPTGQTSALAVMALRAKSDIPSVLEDLRKAARKLAELLDVTIDSADGQEKMADLAMLATIDGTGDEDLPILGFHDELREALATLPAERPTNMIGRR